MNGFKVIEPGVLTTYQDLGRQGHRQYGIPLSGAMDAISLRAANLMVGNKESHVGLEITLMGLKLVSLAPLFIAVTGADLGFTINSEYHLPWKSFSLRPGDIIHFSKRREGLRTYLAVQGGFQSPTFLGSGSVFQRGLMGSPLKKGELLQIGEGRQTPPPEMTVPKRYLPKWAEPICVRVILGPQSERFTEDGLHQFLSASYKIKSQSDRMAYRLDGPRIGHWGKADIISEPMVPGSIQVPNDGRPIILMVDGQVTGGYAKIANVIRADLTCLVQAVPGTLVQFEAIDVEEAYKALVEREELLWWLKRNLPPAPN